MAMNIIDYDVLSEELRNIKQSGDEMRDAIRQADEIVGSAIGTYSAEALSGEVASAMRKDWEENVAALIPSYINQINVQIDKMQRTLDTLKTADDKTTQQTISKEIQ